MSVNSYRFLVCQSQSDREKKRNTHKILLYFCERKLIIENTWLSLTDQKGTKRVCANKLEANHKYIAQNTSYCSARWQCCNISACCVVTCESNKHLDNKSVLPIIAVFSRDQPTKYNNTFYEWRAVVCITLSGRNCANLLSAVGDNWQLRVLTGTTHKVTWRTLMFFLFNEFII